MHGGVGVGSGVGDGVGQSTPSGSGQAVGVCADAAIGDSTTATNAINRTDAERLLTSHLNDEVGLGGTNPREVVDPVEHDLREVLVVRELAVGEDVRLPPARVRLLDTVERADRREDLLRVSRFDGDEDVRSRGHSDESSAAACATMDASWPRC
jgi:hypothetical protein